MSPEPIALEAIFVEVKHALDAKLYYLAIAVALTIPDICISLECDTGKIWTNQSKFVAWSTKYIAPQYTYLTGQDIYYLRCGVLHNGKYGHHKSPFDRIMFTLPNTSRTLIHEYLSVDNGGTRESVLTLDVDLFCASIIRAARSWLSDADTNHSNVSANMPNLVRLRPDGLPPHLVGLPVIA